MVDNKESIRQYIQFIADFVNAKNTDEACLKLLENIEKTLSFSSQFDEKARKFFPLLSTYTLLPKQEKVLLELFVEENKLLVEVKNTLEPNGTELITYDPQKEIFVYRAYYATGPEPDDVAIEGPFEKSFSDLEKMIKHELRRYDDDEEYRGWKFREGKELIKVGKTILKLKQTISKLRYSEIKELSKIYPNILLGHKQIQKHRENLKRILNNIVNGKNLLEIEEFQHSLQDYNNFCRVEVKLSRDGSFFNEMIFPREDDFINLNLNAESEGGQWIEPYRIATIFCLIELLKLERSKEYIRKCKVCGKYFPASKNDVRFQKCKICSPKNSMTKEHRRSYQRDYNKRKKQERERQKREARIKYLMSLGYTKNDALEMIEEDSKL